MTNMCVALKATMMVQHANQTSDIGDKIGLQLRNEIAYGIDVAQKTKCLLLW